MRSFQYFATAIGLIFGNLAATAADKKSSSEQRGVEFFERHVRPVLVQRCYECHSEAEEARKGGLLLDRESGWLEGGDSGKAIVPGNLDASLLISAIRRSNDDEAMPPKNPLSEEEVKILEQWVLRGAPGPAKDIGETEFSQLGDQDSIFGKAADHWSFKPVDAAEPPKTTSPAWNQNPVDRFVFSKLAEHKLTPSPPARTTDLIRRISYDLSGLPPSAADYKKEPDSLINDLLNSPRFGEHFARMWLDVARYADTADSYRADTKTPHYYPYAFTYRDYVIDAFNADKPYDQFIREQLAADLMGFEKGSPELAALGFIGVSPKLRMSADFVDDVIDTTTRGFLGMTVACSRCHDHKFEPIPTADYYSLYGVFGSLERFEPWKSGNFPVIKGYDPTPGDLSEYQAKLEKIQLEIKEAGQKKKGRNSIAGQIQQTKLAQLLLFHDGAPARAMTIKERKKPITATIFIRGEASQRGDRVDRHFLKILDAEQEKFTDQNSGRLDLANKIADPKNPLTARVFVNRVWGALTGTYLVNTPSDFGLQGELPSHPELLDWLAADFMSHDWSLKHLVRTIVRSRSYQQGSGKRNDQGLAELDPENRLYHRAKLKRLEIEEIRDSILAVSGQLDPRMRGRAGILLEGDYTRRRSIYGYINRFNLDPTLRAFDFPSPNQSQESRTESIVAPQALFTMNSTFVVDQANALIEGLDFQKGTTREQRVNAVFKAVLQRPADEAEHTRVNRFADIEKSRKVNPWPLLAQALFMSNEFLYVD